MSTTHLSIAALAAIAACSHASPPPPLLPPANVVPSQIALPNPGPGCTSQSHTNVRIDGDRAIVEHVECEGRGSMPPLDDDVPLRTTRLVLHRLGKLPVATDIDQQVFGGMADPHASLAGVLDAPQIRDDAVIVVFSATGDDPDPPYGKRTTLQVYAFVRDTWKSVYEVSGTSVLVDVSDDDPSRATVTPCEKNPGAPVPGEDVVETCGSNELVTGHIHLHWDGTEVEASGLEPPVDRNALP